MADDLLGIPFRPGYSGGPTTDNPPPIPPDSTKTDSIANPTPPEVPDLSNKVLPVPTRKDTEKRASEARKAEAERKAKEPREPQPESQPQVTGVLPGLGGAAEKATSAQSFTQDPHNVPPPSSSNPYAGSTTEGFATTGTTFGGWIDGNDPDDNGRGYWGADTTKWDQHGVALPPAAIRRFYGVSPDDPDFSERVRRGEVLIRVENPNTKQSTLAPLLDLGPAGWTGAGIDMKPYTAYSIGIKDPRSFKGDVNFYPYVDNQTDQRQSSTGNQGDVQPHEIDWDASARRASGTVFARYPQELSPLDKYRQKHPEDRYTTDAALSEKIRTGMGMTTITPEDFQKSITTRDNGQAFDNFLASKTSPLEFYRFKHPGTEKLSDDELIKKLYADKKEPGETLDDFHLRMKPVDNPWWNVMFQRLGSWMRPVSVPIMTPPAGTMPTAPVPAGGGGGGETVPQQTPMTPSPQEAQQRFSPQQGDVMTAVREMAKNLHAATGNLEKSIGLDKLTNYLNSLQPNFDTGWESGLGQIYEYPSDVATLWNSTVGLAKAQFLQIPKDSPFFQYTKQLSDAYKRDAAQAQANSPKPANFADEVARALTEGAGATGPEGLKFLTGFAGAEFYGAEKAAMIVAAIEGVPNAAQGKPIESIIDMTTAFAGARVISSPIGRWKTGILTSILGMSNQTAKDVVEGKNTDLHDLARNGVVGGILGVLAGQAKSELNEFGVNPAATLHRPAEPPPLPPPPRFDAEKLEGRKALPGPTQPRPQVIAPAPGRRIAWLDPDVLRPYIRIQPKSPANIVADIQAPLRDGQPIRAPEIRLDANGRIAIKDFNRVDALLQFGLDAIPVNVDEAAYQALRKRGYIIPENGVEATVNGHPVLSLTDAQRQLVDKATEQYSNGQVNEAASTIDNLLASLDPATRAALTNILDKKLNEVEPKNPEAKATQNRETVENLDQGKPDNPEVDSSNPNGQWPTSDALSQEALRLGAMSKAEFLEAVKTANPTILERLAKRFGQLRPQTKAGQRRLYDSIKLWRATQIAFGYAKPDSDPPEGISAEEWKNTHPNAKAAIAADIAREKTGGEPKPHYASPEEEIASTAGSLKEVQDQIKREFKARLDDLETKRGELGEEQYSRARKHLERQLDTSLQNGRIEWEQKLWRAKTPSMREVVSLEKQPVLGADGKTLKDEAGNYKYKYTVRMTDKGGNVHEHTVDTPELAAKVQKVLYSIYQDSKPTSGHEYFYANPLSQAGDLLIEGVRIAAQTVLPHVRRAITDPIGKFISEQMKEKGVTETLGLSLSEKTEVAKGIMRESGAQAQTMMNQILHMQSVRDKLQQLMSKGDQSVRRQAYWDQFTHAEILQDLANYQKGQLNPDPVKQALMESDKGVYDLLHAIDLQFNLKEGYVDFYLPGIYRPQDLAKLRANWQHYVVGKPGFTYAKHFHDYEQAFLSQLKLRPRFHNPELIKLHRMQATQQMIAKKLAYAGMENIGLAIRRNHPLADQWLAAVGLGEPENWAVSPTGEKFVFHPDAHHLVKNRFSLDDWVARAPGAGALRYWKGLELKSELALSAFHLLHIATMSVADDISTLDPTAIDLIKGGQLLLNHLLPWDRLYMEKTDKATGQRSYLEKRIGWHGQYPDVLNYYRGEGNYPADPVAQRMISLLHETGLSVHMSRESELAFMGALREGARSLNIQNRKLYGALSFTDGALNGLLGQPWLMSQLFNRYIPLAKMRASMALIEQLFQKHPNLQQPQTKAEVAQRKAEMAKIGEMVEHRYGEINFNNVFMARWLKTAGTLGLLSLSWKMGMIRTYGGAAADLGNSALHLDQILNAKKAGSPDAPQLITNQMRYAFWLAMVCGLIAGSISALFKKRLPDQFIDFVYPVIGTDNQGRPIRGRTPFWSAELVGLFEQMFSRGVGPTVVDTLRNWGSPAVGSLTGILTNRDYYGNPISEHGLLQSVDAWTQPKEWVDRLSYVLNRMLPITVQQALEAGSMGEVTGGVGKLDLSHFNLGQALIAGSLSFVGLSRAPKWTMRTPAENRIMDFYSSHLAPYEKRYEDIPLQAGKNELKYAHQFGTKEDEEHAISEMRKAGATDEQIKRQKDNLRFTDAENAIRHMEVRDRVTILKELADKFPQEVDHYLQLAGPKARAGFRSWQEERNKPVKRFGEGGVVTQPTVALVGDTGPEAIIPLDHHDPVGLLQQLVSERDTKAQPQPLPGELEPSKGKAQVDPRSEKALKDPDLVIRRPFQKGGDILPGTLFPWWEQGEALPPGDTVLPDAPNYRGTNAEDFPNPEYDYGDKLPRNRGIPIPLEELINPALQL